MAKISRVTKNAKLDKRTLMGKAAEGKTSQKKGNVKKMSGKKG